MGSCVFQCDVPHQYIAQGQIGPVPVYCDGVGCHIMCLRHGIPVRQHIGQSTTATSRHCILPQMFKSDVNPQTNKLVIENNLKKGVDVCKMNAIYISKKVNLKKEIE